MLLCLALACAAIGAAPTPAGADWLIIPHLGTVFGGDTTLVDLDQGASTKKFTFGGSVLLLSDGLFGLEADAAHTPRFFERGDRATLVLNSAVSTVTGSLVLAVPVAVTRESLRPYVLGGVGLMHASSTDVVDIFSFDSNQLALTIGGGAIGMLSPRSGVRFDVRQIRTLSPDDTPATTSGSARLSFWRASVGVVIRY